MSSASELVPHDLSIRGVRVRYFEAGRGKPLLLVHGFLVDSREWAQVIPALAPHFRIIAPDLPGFGQSERPLEFRYDREAFAETLCDLLAGLDIARTLVVGHSFGGAVSIVLAADHPERVERLALLNTISYPFVPPLPARLALTPVLGPLLFKRLYRRPMFHRYFRSSVFAPGFRANESAIDAYYRAFDAPGGREAALRVLPWTTDVRSLEPKIPRIRAPTLVVWGVADPMFPVAFGMRLAREIEDSRLETLAGCGHSPAEEMPEQTVEMLKQHFLPKSPHGAG